MSHEECIYFNKSVPPNHEIRITVHHSGRRSFVVLQKSDHSPPINIASGTLHWGQKKPVRFTLGSHVPNADFPELILRTSYDMYQLAHKLK
jgi:hypothetical protein